MKKFFRSSTLKRLLTFALCAFLLVPAMTGCEENTADGNLVIELKGNPTTGYTWVYLMSQEGIIAEVDSSFRGPSSSDLLGVGGIFRFEFEAVAPGEVGVQFNYLRTFQENSVVETVNYFVTVDEKLNITYYTDAQPETDEPIVDNTENEPKIVAGDTFTHTVIFGETTQDVEMTWTLCNAGFYIGVDENRLEWFYANGYDTIVPVNGIDPTATIGTMMTARRHRDTSVPASEFADNFVDEQEIFTDTVMNETSFGDYPAIALECTSTETDVIVTATYYFVQVDGDVVEIAIFCEGLDADDVGSRLYAMLETVTFCDIIGHIE